MNIFSSMHYNTVASTNRGNVMARKKTVRTKKAAGKKNPLATLKAKLAKLTTDLKVIQAKVSDASKRAAALEKAQAVPAAKKASAKKAAPKKKVRKKRAAKKAM